jgi:hypothetical protein
MFTSGSITFAMFDATELTAAGTSTFRAGAAEVAGAFFGVEVGFVVFITSLRARKLGVSEQRWL